MASKHRLSLLAVLAVLLVLSVAAITALARRTESPREASLGPIGEVSEAFQVVQIPDEESRRFAALIRSSKEESASGQGGKVHYFADGHSLSDENSMNRQATWVCILNPSRLAVRLTFTFFYEDTDPTTMEHEVPAETARSIKLYSREEVLQNRRFGARIESSAPVVVQVTTGYYGKGDKPDWYTRAMHSIICSESISKANYYADGMVIDQEGLRLKEPEWVFLLNPNKAAAKVVFSAYGANEARSSYALEIPPQRLFALQLDKIVEKNNLFGAMFLSSVPIAVQQTRWVEEQDRQTIRSAYSVMAKPGDLSPEADSSALR